MSIPYEDLYNGKVSGVYVNLVQISCTTMDGVEREVYLNDSGSAFDFNGHTYLAAAFSLQEPDRTSPEEGSGSLTIGGVPSEYVAYIQEANARKDFILKAALVKLVLDNGTLVVEGEGTTDPYIGPIVEYDISSVSMQSASGTATFSLKTGGTLGYVASSSRYTSTDFPGLSG